MPEEILIEAENIGKKFCRSLKRSLWYGTRDILSDLNPFSSGSPNAQELRDQEFWALRDISFQLRRGECLGLIGPNGAGKSTLLKIINGLLKPDTGSLTVRGKIGALIELSAGFNPILTGRENIYNRGALIGLSKVEIDQVFDEIVEFAEIGDFIDMPVQNYSSGMSVRLGFAISAALKPDILIIDEVLAVGDVAFRHKCLQRMAELRSKTSMIFVSHSMPQVYRVASACMVLRRGEVSSETKNVGTAISDYLQQVRPPAQNQFGTQFFKVSNPQISTNTGANASSEPLVANYNDSLEISFELEAVSEIKSATVKVSIWNQEILPVMDLVDSSVANFPVDFTDASRKRISTAIPKVILNQGQYSVHIVVTDKNFVRIYSRFENLLTFVVQSPYPTGAPHILSTRWKSTDCPLIN